MKGHVYRRRDRWYVRLELDRDVDPESGAALRRRSGVSRQGYGRKRDAEAALADAIDAARQGWRGPSRKTLASYLRGEWLPAMDSELAPTTAALYRTICEAYVIPSLGARRLEAIMPEDLTALYADLERAGGRGDRALSRVTVRKVHTTLRHALDDAVRRRHIAWNPASSLKGPRVERRREPAAWGAEELRRFLGEIEGHRLEPLWILAATTGMRRSELLGLRWRDVHLGADGGPGELEIRQALVTYGATVRVAKEPKSAASRRTIPLQERAAAALRRVQKRQKTERLAAGPAYADEGLVFTDELGAALSPGATSKAFGRAVKAAGVPRITLHGLRHTFATLGLAAGVDVLEVAAVLGHSSPAITMNVYQHTNANRQRQAIDRIGASIFG